MNQDERQPSWVQAAMALGNAPTGIGCIAPIIIVAAIVIGVQLDRLIGVPRWLWLVLIVGGVTVGMTATVRAAYLTSQEAYRRYRSERASRSDHRSHFDFDDGERF